MTTPDAPSPDPADESTSEAYPDPGQDPGSHDSAEREAALEALPGDAAEAGDQVDEEATHVHDPDDPIRDSTVEE